MSHSQTRPADNWSPLYFLASVGAGGISVTFWLCCTNRLNAEFPLSPDGLIPQLP